MARFDPPILRVVSVGTDTYIDEPKMHRAIAKLEAGRGVMRVFVFTTADKGAGRLTAKVCHLRGVHYALCPALYARYGIPARAMRDRRLIEMLHPHVVLVWGQDQRCSDLMAHAKRWPSVRKAVQFS